MSKGRIMKRLEYIDSMRGLAILLVVTGHILFFGFQHSDNNYLYAFLNNQFQLPLFFLISGFFCYKPADTWNGAKIGKTVRDKFVQLIIPTLFFMGLYVYISDFGIKETLFHSHKNGYWFTFSLFEFILLYIGLILIIKLLRLKKIGEDIFLLLTAILIMYAGVFFLRKADIYPAVYLLNLNHLPLFIYFVLGIVIHKHFDTVCQCIENKYALGAIIVASCILNIYTFTGGGFRTLVHRPRCISCY